MEAYHNCHTSTTHKSGTKGKPKKMKDVHIMDDTFLVHLNMSHNREAGSIP